MPEHISLYFQRNYILEITKIGEIITDPEWVTVKYIKVTKYNRTTSSVNGVGNVLRDLPDNVLVSITYILLFPRIILFIPFSCFTFHTRIFTNIIDVLPLNNKRDLHFSGNQSVKKVYYELDYGTFKNSKTLIFTFFYRINMALKSM